MKVSEKRIPNKQIPVIFQKVKEYENADSRFLKMKIWLMHTGINLNSSYFSKESVEKAIPSLANTPVLAFIEENSEGELDFSDHRMVLHRTVEGDVNLRYMGSAVGVIPEDNNARWETRVTDSGEAKEYLVVDALMWTKWDDPIDIMKNKGFTSQSMELSDDYSGDWDDEGVFHFDEFKFFGACLLGNDVLPAMKSSTAEIQFSKNENMQTNIENKLQEFYTLFSQEGGNNMPEENTKVESEEVVETEVETEVTETDEAKVENETEDTQSVESTQEETQEDANDSDEPEDTTQASETFEDDSVTESKEDDTDDSDEAEEEVDNQEEDSQESVDYEAKFNQLADNHATLTSDFEALQSQLSELQSYKRQREENDLKSRFEGQLSDEEFTSVFTEFKEDAIDKVEEKLFALIGKKTYSVKTNVNKDINKLNIVTQKEKASDNPFDVLFATYLQK